MEIHKTQGKCIDNAEESYGPLGYYKDADINGDRKSGRQREEMVGV